jgi:hypothetical protein
MVAAFYRGVPITRCGIYREQPRNNAVSRPRFL